MGSERSGRYSHYEGKLTQVGLKFPKHTIWYILAKRICRYKGISFNEYVRQLVHKDVQHYKNTKMWSCKCTTKDGKMVYWFNRTHYCSDCGEYQLELHRQLYNK